MNRKTDSLPVKEYFAASGYFGTLKNSRSTVLEEKTK